MATQQGGETPFETPPEPAKKTPEQVADEAAAKQAHTKLKLFKVTTDRKIVSPQPHAEYSLQLGANHFEGDLPEPVAKRFAALQKVGTITVETLDGDGKATPWKPAETK